MVSSFFANIFNLLVRNFRKLTKEDDMKKLKELKEKLTTWFQNLWDRFTTFLAKAVAWIVENKLLAIAIFSTVTKAAKYGSRIYSAKKEDEWRNRRFYDRRTDRWSYAKRKLTKRQEAIIERRYQDGETYRSILDDMGLLK